MSKRAYISRYMLIVKKLKAKPYSTYEELEGYVDHEVEYLRMMDDGLEIGFSRRTLQRDIKEIRNLFGVAIEYSVARRGYFIGQGDTDNMNFYRMMEAFEVFSSLNMARDITPHILLEQRKSQGTEHMYGLLHAIKNKFKIYLFHQKFGERYPTRRTLAPYSLKEFKHRWYLIGKDDEEDRLTMYSLDRIKQIEITTMTYSVPVDYNPEASFKYSFGIISNNGTLPEYIILSFSHKQGYYIKSLPLHPTQEVLVDNDKELRVRLKLWITYDFIQEVLSHGAEVRVIAPQSLIDDIKEVNMAVRKLYR